jgi:hypothetical protein
MSLVRKGKSYGVDMIFLDWLTDVYLDFGDILTFISKRKSHLLQEIDLIYSFYKQITSCATI